MHKTLTNQIYSFFVWTIIGFDIVAKDLLETLYFITWHHMIHSMFMKTNETVNIWTHLCGFVFFSFLLMVDVFSYLPENSASTLDYGVFIIMDVCFQVSYVFCDQACENRACEPISYHLTGHTTEYLCSVTW